MNGREWPESGLPLKARVASRAVIDGSVAIVPEGQNSGHSLLSGAAARLRQMQFFLGPWGLMSTPPEGAAL